MILQFFLEGSKGSVAPFQGTQQKKNIISTRPRPLKDFLEIKYANRYWYEPLN